MCCFNFLVHLFVFWFFVNFHDVFFFFFFFFFLMGMMMNLSFLVLVKKYFTYKRSIILFSLSNISIISRSTKWCLSLYG